jgi:hypothetical protein
MGEAFYVMYKNLRVFSVGAFASVGWKWDKKYIQPLSKAAIRKSIDVSKLLPAKAGSFEKRLKAA